MSRARATALILVNWRGVFFERYLLDRHVTALEGANGAGKTTVMIGAYVVLLPDLTRLKFTNLGETGATGGDRGIYGRLGEPGPSYAALEIDIDGRERIFAGVYLERKAPPALTLTPFIISEVSAELAAHRVFLREADAHEHVATMADIEEAVLAAQAKLEVFGSAKDYFGSLFERGVSPLRLGLDEERNKFNDMLRTSMTGGISRTLTSDLRSFLFKQQTGLFDTLTRMRKNLDACRRTRIEVSEARVLEHEINGIYLAGHAMFEAALEGARSRAREHRAAAERALAAVAAERDQLAELATREREAESRAESIGPRLERARAAESAAREQLAELSRGLAAAERLQKLEGERQQLLPDVELALSARQAAAALRETARAERDAAQQTLARAAGGLASLQAGLEELHRQAHAHRRARDRFAAAQSALADVERHAEAIGLPDAKARAGLATLESALGAALLAAGAPGGASPETRGLTADQLADGARQVDLALRALDAARAEHDRRAQLFERRRRAHAEARAALALVCGEPVAADYEARARRELARLNELELLGTRQDELARDSQQSRALADRQRAVRAEARALGFADDASAADFMRELAAVDAQWLQTNERWREHEAAAHELAERASATLASERALAPRLDEHRKLVTLGARLTASGVTAPLTRAELAAALRASHAARRALALRGEELAIERQAALDLAQRHEAMGGGVPDELARLAEAVDGQLLAARYEDLELDEARRTQAELGPLLGAIVVDDLARALKVAIEEARAPDGARDVWLLEAGAAPPPELSGSTAGAVPRAAVADALAQTARGADAPVIVDLGHGVRVSRLPEEVSLGRAARQRRAERAREEAEAASTALTSLEARGREQDAVTRDLEILQEHWDTWALGDPSGELERLAAERRELEGRREERLGAGREQRVELARLGARREALRALLPEHTLLDPPDQSERAERVRAQLEAARGAAAELERLKGARQTLIARVHELADPPPDASELETLERRRPELEAQRDRLFATAEALAVAAREQSALGFVDAERALTERTELVPELEAQHERALSMVAAAQLALDQAEARWEQSTGAAQRADASLAAIDAHLARARKELGGPAGVEPSAEAVNAAREALDARAAALAVLMREASSVDAERSLARERRGEADKRLKAAQALADTERRAAEPSEAAWRELEAAAEAARASEPDATFAENDTTVPSAQRFLEAESKRELLVDRLAAARGGSELAETLGGRRPGPPGEFRLGQFYFEAWLEVRAWLLRRLPAQIAELGQPLLGLGRLRADLGELEGRLARQEGELRGTSADVARSIDVQLRRAAAQVKRLCRALEGVSFGSIAGMRVQLARVEKMDQVLAALREGKTQELLFQSNLPIEEALDEIFKRHAGGRTGGQRLIDYREYLELWVEIQRRTEQKWERVNPSQVSTGEAIGVGAALMMVILAEWERDDQLLRHKRAFGSLRFLFLDEANRLSQDNLGVLFDLCKVLDLQLLIAAPEVARAEGNTTYRLVRRVTDDGLEEVLVTGRRATLPGVDGSSEDVETPHDGLEPPLDAAAPLEAPPAPAPAEQLGLLD